MEKDNIKKEKLFFCAYILWMGCAILNITMWGKIQYVQETCKYIQKIGYLLLLIYYCTKAKYTQNDILEIGIIIGGCFLAGHARYNTQIIPVVIFIVCSKDIEFEKILKCTLGLQIAIMGITVAASQIGIIEDVVWIEKNRVRYSLGYQYCGYPAHILFFIILMWFCVKKTYKFADAIIFLIISYWVYLRTDSRTDFYLSIIGIIGFLLYDTINRTKIGNWLYSFMVRYAFIFATAVSIIIHMVYDPTNTFLKRLNSILNNRLRLGHAAIEQYGFSLLGKEIKWYGQGSIKADPTRVYNYVDNSFLKELLSYGIIFIIVLAAGYYFLGIYLNKKKLGYLKWAVLMSLAYALINAHLCVMAFNVFILLLGKSLEDEKVNVKQDIIHYQIEKVISALTECNNLITSKKIKKNIRIMLYLSIMIYMSYIQIMGTKYMVTYASMHRWLVCGIGFIITILYSDHLKEEEKKKKSILYYSILIFLIMGCISDFLVQKKFQYSSFGLLIFGGLFYNVWERLSEPQSVLIEMKSAYKIWFVLVILCCMGMYPAMPGICYAGIFKNAEIFSLYMLIAVVIFLSDSIKREKNIIGVVVALYMIWMTQQTEMVLVCIIIGGEYCVFRVWRLIKDDKEKKNLGKVIRNGMYGLIIIAIIRFWLYHITQNIPFAVTYNRDNLEIINQTVLTSIKEGSWIQNIQNNIEVVKEYLKQINIWGHNYLLQIWEKKIWAANSVVMNMFRYGIFAGVFYLMMTVAYVIKAVKLTTRRQEFGFIALATVNVLAGMLLCIEMPFVQLGWIIYYIGIAAVLVMEKSSTNNLY